VRVEQYAGSLQGHRAGLVSRIAAGIVDLFVVGLLALGTYCVVAGVSFVAQPRDFTFPRPAPELSFIFYFLATTIYLAVGWTVTGRTIGKQLAGLRIVTDKRTRVRPAVALTRAIACVVFPVGLLWCAVSNRNASVHDMLFRTVVIYDWSSRIPPSAQDSIAEEIRAH
jgi:uncharacterized RDD family membrane protein YckC